MNYWNTYSPVVSWSSVRIMLTLSKLHEMCTRSIDFTLAFPQADVKATIFVHNPPGVELHTDKNKYVLKLLKNVYGLKDADVPGGNT